MNLNDLKSAFLPLLLHTILFTWEKKESNLVHLILSNSFWVWAPVTILRIYPAPAQARFEDVLWGWGGICLRCFVPLCAFSISNSAKWT